MSSQSRNSKIVIITQARTGSTRLPGKVLREVCGKTLLEHHVDRLLCSDHVDEVIVATSTALGDDAIEDLCKARGYKVFRGDEADVLSRYAGAAEAFGGDVILRVTSDCPLIDPAVIDDLVDMFLSSDPPLDYARLDTTSYPHGLDTEIFSRSALMTAATEAVDPEEREHVTAFLYRHPDRFRIATLQSEEAHSGHRWCVDEERDFAFVSRVIEALYPENPTFGWRDCIEVLRENPDWISINRDVKQKTLKAQDA